MNCHALSSTSHHVQRRCTPPDQNATPHARLLDPVATEVRLDAVEGVDDDFRLVGEPTVMKPVTPDLIPSPRHRRTVANSVPSLDAGAAPRRIVQLFLDLGAERRRLLAEDFERSPEIGGRRVVRVEDPLGFGPLIHQPAMLPAGAFPHTLFDGVSPLPAELRERGLRGDPSARLEERVWRGSMVMETALDLILEGTSGLDRRQQPVLAPLIETETAGHLNGEAILIANGDDPAGNRAGRADGRSDEGLLERAQPHPDHSSYSISTRRITSPFGP